MTADKVQQPTATPWRAEGRYIFDASYDVIVHCHYSLGAYVGWGNALDAANAAFIVEAVNNYDPMKTRIGVLEDERARYREALVELLEIDVVECIDAPRYLAANMAAQALIKESEDQKGSTNECKKCGGTRQISDAHPGSDVPSVRPCPACEDQI